MTDADWLAEMRNRVSEAIAAAQRANGCEPDGDPCGGAEKCRCIAMVLYEVERHAP